MRAIKIIFLLFCFSSAGQDFHADYQEMLEFLDSHESYKLSVNYATSGDRESNEQGDISVIVSGKGLFYDLGFSSVIVNQENMIVVDDVERTIIYSENQPTKKKHSRSISEVLLEGLDSAIVRADTIVYYEHNGEKVYAIRTAGEYFNLTEITFKNKLIHRVTYYYNEQFIDQVGVKATCEIKFEPSPTFDIQLLNSEFYFTIVNGKTIPTSEFVNYLIVYNESLESYLD